MAASAFKDGISPFLHQSLLQKLHQLLHQATSYGKQSPKPEEVPLAHAILKCQTRLAQSSKAMARHLAMQIFDGIHYGVWMRLLQAATVETATVTSKLIAAQMIDLATSL